MKRILQNALAELTTLMHDVAAMEDRIAILATDMKATFDAGHKVLMAGNGGSAADAMHFCEELVARFMKNRRALAAIALCDPTVLTCTANDFGYENVFSRQVEAFGNAGDMLIVFTTSGNSANILAAIQAAKKRNMKSIAFLGKGGGKARGQCDIEFIVNSKLPHRIQEIHQLIYHSVCEWIDENL